MTTLESGARCQLETIPEFAFREPRQAQGGSARFAGLRPVGSGLIAFWLAIPVLRPTVLIGWKALFPESANFRFSIRFRIHVLRTNGGPAAKPHVPVSFQTGSF